MIGSDPEVQRPGIPFEPHPVITQVGRGFAVPAGAIGWVMPSRRIAPGGPAGRALTRSQPRRARLVLLASSPVADRSNAVYLPSFSAGLITIACRSRKYDQLTEVIDFAEAMDHAASRRKIVVSQAGARDAVTGNHEATGHSDHLPIQHHRLTFEHRQRQMLELGAVDPGCEQKMAEPDTGSQNPLAALVEVESLRRLVCAGSPGLLELFEHTAAEREPDRLELPLPGPRLSLPRRDRINPVRLGAGSASAPNSTLLRASTMGSPRRSSASSSRPFESTATAKSRVWAWPSLGASLALLR